MEDPRYPQIWQCVGMMVGVYGVGYWVAANDPFRHWPIVLVGLIGKTLGPIGFLQAAIAESLPWGWGATIVTNDLIWWLPFAVILYGAFRVNTDTSRDTESPQLKEVMNGVRSNRDATLAELSSTAPTLLIFLRHAGCTFCRQTLAEIQRSRKAIEQSGTMIAIVHMGTPMDGTLMLRKYAIEDLHRFSDPRCELYRAFGLKRGTAKQLFGPSVARRSFAAICGHGLGLLNGDGFRMPGAFVLAHGEIVEANRPKTAADVLDLVSIAKRAPRLWRNARDLSVLLCEDQHKGELAGLTSPQNVSLSMR